MTPAPRTDPRVIREVLDHLDTHGPYLTAKHFGLYASTVYRWRAHRDKVGQQWPTAEDIAAWDAKAPVRERNLRRWRRTAHQRHFQTGPLTVNATGTIRRVRALVALGYSQPQIGAALGVSGARVSQLCRGYNKVILRSTADRVRALYDGGWSMTTPSGPTADRLRSYAKSRRWRPPLAWDDETINDPSARPCGVRGSRPSRTLEDAA